MGTDVNGWSKWNDLSLCVANSTRNCRGEAMDCATRMNDAMFAEVTLILKTSNTMQKAVSGKNATAINLSQLLVPSGQWIQSMSYEYTGGV